MVGGQEGNGHAAGVDRVDAVRIRENEIVIDGHVFRLALGAHGHNPLPHRQAAIGYVRAQRGDGSRCFQSQGGRQVGTRVIPLAAHDVGVVDAGRVDLDQRLVRAGRGLRRVLPLQDLDTAVFFDAQGFHWGSLLMGGRCQAGPRRLGDWSTSELITRIASPEAKARMFSTTPE